MNELNLRVEEILNDPRLEDDLADEDELVAEYGSYAVPEAIYLLADEYGWEQVFDLLIRFLQDDRNSRLWEIAQVILFYAAADHKNGTHRRPMPADSTIALLYHRFPNGTDDGDRIWSIVCALKNKEHWSHYDPLQDIGVQHELAKLR